MTRPAHTRVRHGMASCSRYGCTRPECRAAARNARRQLDQDRARGITARVDADEAATHARHLTLNGMSAQDIADRSGIYVKTITRLIAGRCQRVYRDTAEAILGVPVPPPGYRPANEGLVDATGSRRRLQALTARGFTLAVLGREVGVHAQTIGCIRQGRRAYVRISVHQAIAAAYDRLQTADPIQCGAHPDGAVRARAWAARQNWADPTWWEDMGGIDDETAPENEAELPAQSRHDVLAEDGLWLERTQGYSRRHAAERLGVTRAALQKALDRARKAQAGYEEAA